MRRRLVVLCLLAVATIAPRRSPCAELNGLSFVLTTARKVYRIGEPIIVNYTLTNTTDNALVVSDLANPENDGGGVSVLFDGSRPIARHGDLCSGPRRIVILDAGKSSTSPHDFSALYSFATPGRYVIRVTYSAYEPAPKHWRGSIPEEVWVWVQE